MKRVKPSSPRAIAVDLLSMVLDKGRLLDEVLDDPRLSPLDERDRGFVRMLLGTTLRRLGQIDSLIEHCLDKPMRAGAAWAEHALRLGICQLLFLDVAPHAAISTTVDLVKGGTQAGFAKLLNAVLRRLDREGRDLIAAQDAELLNTPEWLWRSWARAYGEDIARAIAAAHLVEAPVDISVAADPAAWAERLEASILPTGSLRRSGGGAVVGLPGFDEGKWWVQDAAAALPARLLGDVRGQRVADLCAAPGGKALQLAVAGAKLTALDRSAKRLKRFTDNLRRLGLTANVVEADAGAWIPPEPFDAVLLDAPCSATGTLRRHPDVARHKNPAEVMKLAGVQARLLRAALGMLKPGGLLVYCTCSLEPEEGPDQIAALLAEGAPIERVAIGAEEVGGMAELITPEGDLRTLPCHLGGLGGMDAFFAARLRKV
ncbi:MFS transporter [Magnetospirillum sp. ME-1]|uniref:RsmB/NOP family class I SAM-dependent RNA methyltransferase n=1 Tax=Magnetospirillum sp. ME-1 TaxID=1639348 RepID=UPI000A17DF4B|nr:transcription antitermination factor NusB [Magnetospirillum sp. ME-1]ARJ66586.1 MFS transporter [Magnetospirillum sp. ME-1]